jgi:hypothetical protein
VNKRAASIGIAIAVLVGPGLAATLALRGQVAPAQSDLPTCEWNEALFATPTDEELEKASTAEIWSREYHKRVHDVIDAHFAPAGSDLQCEVQPIRYASTTLKGLAEFLSPWNEDGGGSLKESDMGSVLLEHLRSYECALRLRWFLLPTFVAEEMGNTDTPTDSSGFGSFAVPKFLVMYTGEQRFIQTELVLARRALHRTLTAIVGHDRLTPLDGTTECLARTSLDLSNEMSLAAGVSACLPSRTWDTNGSLLDLSTEQ